MASGCPNGVDHKGGMCTCTPTRKTGEVTGTKPKPKDPKS